MNNYDKMYEFDNMELLNYLKQQTIIRKEEIEAVNYVLNCTKPSKSTIGDFLLVYKDLVSSFDEFIKKFAINLGLIEGKNIYWDGTFIKAYCNNHKKMYPAQILYLDSFIKKHFDNYLNGNGTICEMMRNYYYGIIIVLKNYQKY